MAPCKDPRRGGQRTRIGIGLQNLVEQRHAKAAERAIRYRERKRDFLVNTVQSAVGLGGTSYNIDRATSRAADEWAVRWFHETSSKELQFQKNFHLKF